MQHREGLFKLWSGQSLGSVFCRFRAAAHGLKSGRVRGSAALFSKVKNSSVGGLRVEGGTPTFDGCRGWVAAWVVVRIRGVDTPFPPGGHAPSPPRTHRLGPSSHPPSSTSRKNRPWVCPEALRKLCVNPASYPSSYPWLLPLSWPSFHPFSRTSSSRF
jgi:hypothetical protein